MSRSFTADEAATIQACARLIADYGHAADHDDLDGFLSVFTPDATCERADGSVMHGHDDLRAFFLGRPPGRPPRCHAAASIRVTPIAADRAESTSLTTVYPLAGSGSAGGAAPVSIIEYTDTFTRGPDGWRISSRRGRYLFRAGPGGA